MCYRFPKTPAVIQFEFPPSASNNLPSDSKSYPPNFVGLFGVLILALHFCKTIQQLGLRSGHMGLSMVARFFF